MRLKFLPVLLGLMINVQLSAEVKEVSGSTIQSEISNSTGKVVVDFYADWCAPCKRFAPIFSDVAKSSNGEITFLKVRLQDGDAAWKNFNIDTIPAVILFENGKEVKRHGSFADTTSFNKFLSVSSQTAEKVSAKRMEIQEIDSDNFEDTINKGETIVEFYSSSCPHCKQLAPIYEKVATSLYGRYKFARVELPRSKDIAYRYNVKHTPTVILYRNGQEQQRHVGLMDENRFLGLIHKTYVE